MGRRGPPRTPTVLALVRGNPGKRATNHEEPELESADVAPPAKMPKAALAEWHRLAKELVEKGLLTVGDRVTFETYCRIVADVEKLEAMKNKVGIGNAIKLGFTGQLIKMRAQLKQYAAELGLTPSSRSGVKAAKTKSPSDAVKKRFFGGGAGG